jgi:hypothetical protein
MTAVGAVMDPFSCGIVDSMFFDRPDAVGGLNQTSDGAVGKAAEMCEIVRVVPRAKHESWQ